MDATTWTFIILGAAIVAFVSSRIPIAVVSLGVIVALWATGVLTLPEVFAGFGDPTIIFIASLFVVIEALQASGLTAWIAQKIIQRSGRSRTSLLAIFGLTAALLGAFISVSGSAGALIPVVVVAAVRAAIPASKLLMPLAFFATGGSLLTLTSSPVNIIVSQTAAADGGRAFGYFEFALVGVPLVILTMLIVIVAGNRLLPVRTPDSVGIADPALHARELRDDYSVDAATSALFTATDGVAEVLVAPRSNLIGRDVAPGMTMDDDSVVVMAVRSGGAPATAVAVSEDAMDAVTLRAGDALLVQGPWDALNRYVASTDVIAVDEPQLYRRAIPLGKGWKRALVIFVAMVALLVSGLVPTAIATLLAAMALVLTGVVKIPQIYQSIPWTIIILVSGLIPLANAFTQTGAAQLVADQILSVVGSFSPHMALLVLILVTITLGQFMSNLATVMMMIPIGLAIAHASSVSIQPFMMALAVAGAASFMTPIATPGNMIVMQPGGYRFGDYWRLGLPIMIVYLLIAVFYVPVIWPF